MYPHKSMFGSIFSTILAEDISGNVAGSGGVLGSFTQSQFSADNYAVGDSRIPKILGKVQKRTTKKNTKRKKKRKSVE
jgi:hypothetical protein